MDKQRLYDAMLIKAFRADATVGHLWWWLKGLGIEIPDKTLKRQPPSSKMRVQTFVGVCLKPLADRLWDTDRSQDIKTLDWMVNLDSQRTGDSNWKRNLQRKVMGCGGHKKTLKVWLSVYRARSPLGIRTKL